MRQSSSTSEPDRGQPRTGGPETHGALFGALFGDPSAAAELSDAAVLRAMLDVEAALARAQAAVGVIPADAAAAIGAGCADTEWDLAAIGVRSLAAGNPVVPMVRDLTAALPDHARPWVHYGATSQDILDTALSLVAGRALRPVLAALDSAADAAAGLARRHRGTVMVGRTLGQQAAVTTFGLVAAGWLYGLDESSAALRAARAELAVQLGGAVGTLAALGDPAGGTDTGNAVVTALADELGLVAPVLPWHTDRQRFLALAAALGRVGAATGKVGLDVGLLAQTEVAELSEADGGGRGGSSAMPHKRNPVDSVLVVAAARRCPGPVATLLAAGSHEHQRAAGAWHAEWEPLLELLRVVGGSAARTRMLLQGLRVDSARMLANLRASGGLLMAESVAALLAPALGRTHAHDIVATCCRSALDRAVPLRTALLAEPQITAVVSVEDIDRALDETTWLGSADTFTAAALRHHATLTQLTREDHP